jgi:triosephosphate isomerase
MSRKPFIAGNWKMHKTVAEAVALAVELKELLRNTGDVDILLCPPFTALHAVGAELRGTNILLGAQNMFYEDSGPFTGEISPLMLKDLNCSHVILGHSERRRYFCETDELINRKVLSAISHRITPILCVGEQLEERENHREKAVVERQLRSALKGVPLDTEFLIAYEPVWAIGTGRTATPEVAQEMHSFIREVLEELFSPGKADSVRILYGGSVKPENAKSLLSMEDVDGLLVGGASLVAKSFAEIVLSGRS